MDSLTQIVLGGAIAAAIANQPHLAELLDDAQVRLEV